MGSLSIHIYNFSIGNVVNNEDRRVWFQFTTTYEPGRPMADHRKCKANSCRRNVKPDNRNYVPNNRIFEELNTIDFAFDFKHLIFISSKVSFFSKSDV